MNEHETPDGSATEREGAEDGEAVSESEAQEIAAEREERLDPENRPHHAEVDNTQRDFDEENGEFLDDGDESDLTEEERAATGDGA